MDQNIKKIWVAADRCPMWISMLKEPMGAYKTLEIALREAEKDGYETDVKTEGEERLFVYKKTGEPFKYRRYLKEVDHHGEFEVSPTKLVSTIANELGILVQDFDIKEAYESERIFQKILLKDGFEYGGLSDGGITRWDDNGPIIIKCHQFTKTRGPMFNRVVRVYEVKYFDN